MPTIASLNGEGVVRTEFANRTLSFRERLQLGYKEQWLLKGDIDETKLWFPLPFTERPDLGTRMLIRNYSRFWIKALFRDVKGLNMEN